MRLLGGTLDICVDEEQVHLTVDVFEGNLKAVETLSFRQRALLRFLLTMPSDAAKNPGRGR